MPQCDHEEADTRIIVHVRHAFKGGSESVLVRTVDTDVVVILVGKFHDLMTYNQRAVICVAFGMGRYFNSRWLISTRSVLLLERLNHDPYQYSMPSLGATAPLHSMVSGSRPHGRYGNLLAMMSHLPWSTSQLIPSSSSTSSQNISRSLKGWRFSCMTSRVPWSLSTRLEWCCSQRATWTTSLQHRYHVMLW